MHMSDALVSPATAAVTGVAAVALLAVAVRKTGWNCRLTDESDRRCAHAVPLMGVMGAFVFAAQMINFSIPGTGSSGHIVGGVLLAAVLGAWPAFVTLSSVIILQCLLFADGGLMALGCNILNMAALSCLMAYPAIYRPLAGGSASRRRIVAASMLASVVSLELGALAVVAETSLSSIAALPVRDFIAVMLPIHLAIGIGEGLATSAVVVTLHRYDPSLLVDGRSAARTDGRHWRRGVAAVLAVTLVMAASFSWLASSKPDGLEWSVAKVNSGEEVTPADGEPIYDVVSGVQRSTAVMPEYDTSLAGLVGCGVILLAVFGVSRIYRPNRRRT
ncbi:MAG: energy-coupling factor ABC transporter permease [Alistipes sp.]|nr:energy-coupling factor ABC transporter permease [Alistipes sp.]